MLCQHCEDIIRTGELIDDLAEYADTPGADQTFANIAGFALGTAFRLALKPELYPPTGHTYPARDDAGSW